jgi:hypothetical protein
LEEETMRKFGVGTGQGATSGRAALVLAVIALVVAIGGGTVAIATSTGAREKKVVTRIVRKLAPRLSVAHAGTADRAGTAGSADDAGKLGGSPASAFEPRPQWALVNSGGTVLAQSGGISVNTTYAANGIYYVDFGTSIANRPVSVTGHYGDGGLTAETSVSPCGGSSVPGGFECTSTPGVNDSNHVLVRTRSGSGADLPFGFYVVVGN